MVEETEKIILDEIEPTTQVYAPLPRLATEDPDEAGYLFEVMLKTPLPVPSPDELDLTIEE